MEKHQHTPNNDLHTNVAMGRNVSIALMMIVPMPITTHTDMHVEFLKEWSGQSPTVNISWLIAKAYFANLYYTTQCDASLTIKTCTDIIDVYKQSWVNNDFAEKTFPIVLSTQWTGILSRPEH